MRKQEAIEEINRIWERLSPVLKRCKAKVPNLKIEKRKVKELQVMYNVLDKLMEASAKVRKMETDLGGIILTLELTHTKSELPMLKELFDYRKEFRKVWYANRKELVKGVKDEDKQDEPKKNVKRGYTSKI